MNKYDNILKNSVNNINLSEEEVRRNRFIKMIAAAGEDDVLKVIEYIDEKYNKNIR